MNRHRLASLAAIVVACAVARAPAQATTPIAIGDRRELFVDRYLIERLDGAALKLHPPQDAGTALTFDRPWEGAYCIYSTVLQDGDTFRLYYRGFPSGGHYQGNESTCLAESKDGITWTRPAINRFVAFGETQNNVVTNERDEKVFTLAPFLDTKPGVAADARYKAIACESIFDDKGKRDWVLIALASPDGVTWRRLQEKPVIYNDLPKFGFDSQNLAFWSEHEQKYILYGRSNLLKPGTVRAISRWTSDDFVNWSPRTLVRQIHDGKETADEQLYTNQTLPYFRAPHLYVAMPARLVLRPALTTQQAAAIPGANAKQAASISDTAFATSRGGDVFDRTFMESWIRPGIGGANWLTRSNYAAHGILQTGPAEMSVYVHEHYGLPSAHLRRYTLRLDGFASVNAGYAGGEMTTRPFTFDGAKLVVNYATSAVGEMRFEFQDAAGRAIEGFALADCAPVIGDEIERPVAWAGGGDLSKLAGRPVRLRVRLADADLFAIRFSK